MLETIQNLDENLDFALYLTFHHPLWFKLDTTAQGQ